MAQPPSFELVSFDICPYVQRSIITLKHKKLDFKLTVIDLSKPPEWFEKLSPLGKVPLLLVRGAPQNEPTAIFESAIINEYIDEVTPPSLLPKDPLEKARERAWVAVSGELLYSMYTFMTSKDGAETQEAAQEIWDTLSRVEDVVRGEKTFSANGFSLLDAAFAPVFMRLLMMRSFRDSAEWKRLPKTRRWADSILALPEVRDSVVPDFKQRYVDYLKKNGSPAVSEFDS